MIVFRSRPDPTRQLDISDLRPPNEFDVLLLDEEGVCYDGITVRGATVVSDGSPDDSQRR